MKLADHAGFKQAQERLGAAMQRVISAVANGADPAKVQALVDQSNAETREFVELVKEIDQDTQYLEREAAANPE